MAFRETDENPLPDLAELKSRIADADTANPAYDLRMELRLHPHDIDDNWGAVRVHFTQAKLSLELVGLEVAEKSKLGQPVAHNTSRELTRETIKTKAQDASFGAKAGVNASIQDLGGVGGDASMEMAKKGTSSVSVKETEQIVIANTLVRAVGADNWLIEDGGVLDAVYLNFDRLCTLVPKRGGNRQAVTSRVLVKAKHLRSALEPSSGVGSLLATLNQKRLANILLAKSIHDETSPTKYSGIICLAKSEISDED